MAVDIQYLEDWRRLQEGDVHQDWQRLARISEEVDKKSYSVDMSRLVEVRDAKDQIRHQTTPERDAQVAANARPFLEGRARQLEEIALRRPTLAPYLESAKNLLHDACGDMSDGKFAEASRALQQSEKFIDAARTIDRAERVFDGRLSQKEADRVVAPSNEIRYASVHRVEQDDGKRKPLTWEQAEQNSRQFALDLAPGMSPGERLGMIQKTADKVSALALSGDVDRAKGLLERIVELAKTCMRELGKAQMPDRTQGR